MHRPVVEQRQNRAANVASADAMPSSAAASTAGHLVPSIFVTASLSVHLSCSFRSIMN
jgi:hypothetical protein